MTKVELAARQLVTAIRLFFDNADSVAVHTLAAAARGIIHPLIEQRSIKGFIADVTSKNPGLSATNFYAIANKYANQFKHADLGKEIDVEGFSDSENDGLLLVAARDFGALTGGMEPEMQVYQAWYLACNREKLGWYEPWLDERFPGISKMTRLQQKAFGRHWIEKWSADPEAVMRYRLD